MKKKILIIEDDKIIQSSIKSALELADFETAQLFSGNNAMQSIAEEKPDLILLDLMLPGEDGFNILKNIKDNSDLKKIPVIVLTVINTESSVAECKMLGASDYLIKSDYSLKEIVERVAKLLK